MKWEISNSPWSPGTQGTRGEKLVKTHDKAPAASCYNRRSNRVHQATALEMANCLQFPKTSLCGEADIQRRATASLSHPVLSTMQAEQMTLFLWITAHQSPKVIKKQNKTVIVTWWIERGCREGPWQEDSQGLVHTWERWCLGATAPLLTSKNVVGRNIALETEVNVLILQVGKNILRTPGNIEGRGLLCSPHTYITYRIPYHKRGGLKRSEEQKRRQLLYIESGYWFAGL